MRRYIFISAAGLIAVTILALVTFGLAALPSNATMEFGQPNSGSGCNFPCEDDASFHAVDRIVPGAVSIAAGGTVNFDVEGFHKVTIYAPGKTPKDVEVDGAAFPFVNDPEGRIFFDERPPGADASFTFTEPGKYLVICEVAPHFEIAQMWGWVNVK